jgi:PAS domain-containing protein
MRAGPVAGKLARALGGKLNSVSPTRCRFGVRDTIRGGSPEQGRKAAAKEGQFEDEGGPVRKDGSRFWANVIITALRDKAGDLFGCGKATRDLTECKQTEETVDMTGDDD